MYNANSRIRSLIIAALFVIGMSLVYFGWTMTGRMTGLLIMLLGVVLFLAAIFVYNKPYK